MDILEILKKSKNSLYLEDLDFFETELATGDYKKSYVDKCKEQISLTRKWLKAEKNAKAPHVTNKQDDEATKTIVKDLSGVVVGTPIMGEGVSFEQKFRDDIEYIRKKSDYKRAFTKYIDEKTEVDVKFIDDNFSFFTSLELSEIVSIKQLGEEFLEKYFDALDKNAIAKNQCFSESFFIKHYSQLDATLVLKNDKNEWHDKAKRSKQLDVFLRLKGVNL